MTTYPVTPADARTIADSASEAIRVLNHATLPADGFTGLEYSSDVYHLLGAMQQLAARLPQVLVQTSAFLQRELQYDVITVDDGPFAGDPLGAVGTASHALEGAATRAAQMLAAALKSAHEAIAFASDRRDHMAGVDGSEPPPS
jgi:hypothetical protein